MAKRRRRKRSKGVSWLMIVAIALLIAGFMARRLMMPPTARYSAIARRMRLPHRRSPARLELKTLLSRNPMTTVPVSISVTAIGARSTKSFGARQKVTS